MSWIRAYHLALHFLPAGLRCKHGLAMQELFSREFARARARGRLHGALIGAAGIWDVLRRGAYEHVRPVRNAEGAVGAPLMPQPTTFQLLRRLAISFGIAFVALTVALLALFAKAQVPSLSARGASAGTIAQVLLLAVPFIAAMTIPMAVFIAVFREFTRLGADGTLSSARRVRHGVRRLVMPVLAGAAVVAGLALVEIAEIVPRANTQLASALMGSSAAPNGRTMTLGELRQAERSVQASTERMHALAAAGYEIEIQKKFALSGACLVLALAGVAFAIRIPRSGLTLVLGASVVLFGAYYLLIITGESLAHRLVVSPFVGMWGANALLIAFALLAMRRRRTQRASTEAVPS